MAAAYQIVDAHLDMARRVVADGRDYSVPAAEVRAKERRTAGQCMVTLPELRRGGVGIAFATIHASPATFDGDVPVYRPSAADQAEAQMAIYRGWEVSGRVRILRAAHDLEAHLVRFPLDGVPALFLNMEGADPIGEPADLAEWWRAGLRMVGLSWSRTRYAGGTGRPGGLTPAGRDLVHEMMRMHVPLDVSHMADAAFWEALEIGARSVAATHSNCRALVPGDRHLSDEMIEAIALRDGVIGIVLANMFLDSSWHEGMAPVRLERVGDHARHIAQLVGWPHVGIGSDFDGGFGVEETPEGLDSEADLGKLAEVLPAEARSMVLGANWIRFLRANLPSP